MTKLCTTRGPEAEQWLADNGLPSVIPFIRSSDYGLCLEDPLRYYLTRRLGLSPAFKYAEALAMGTWVHRRLENILGDMQGHSDVADGILLDCAMGEVAADYREQGKAVGASQSMIDDACTRAITDANTANAWWAGACQVKISDEDGTLLDYLSKPHWEILATELDLVGPVQCTAEAGVIYAKIRIDILLYDKVRNLLFVMDLKTSSQMPLLRALACPIEFQTWHYIFTVKNELDDLAQIYKLPKDVKVGGMIHLLMHKPDIKFGQNDRDYWWESDGKRKKVKGTALLHGGGGDWIIQVDEPFTPENGGKAVKRVAVNLTEEQAVTDLHTLCGKKPTKCFSGEPNPNNYRTRCIDWYNAEGDFTDKPDEWDEEPPVNISTTNGDFVLDPEVRQTYYDRVKFIANHATRAAFPNNFLDNPRGVYDWHRKSRFAPFYLRPPNEWPEIMRTNKFVIAHRG